MVSLIGFSLGGSGANRALGRILEVLQSADRANPNFDIRSRVASGGRVRGSLLRKVKPAPTGDEIGRIFRLYLRKSKKFIYRVAGGRVLHSRAEINTSLVSEVRGAKLDVVVANWFGDYTDSIEELGKVRVPLILRNGDMWWFQGSKHFVNPPGMPLSRWQRFLEWLFFGREDTDTRERKKKHLYPVVSATVSPSPWMTQQVVDSGLMPHASCDSCDNPKPA